MPPYILEKDDPLFPHQPGTWDKHFQGTIFDDEDYLCLKYLLVRLPMRRQGPLWGALNFHSWVILETPESSLVAIESLKKSGNGETTIHGKRPYPNISTILRGMYTPP